MENRLLEFIAGGKKFIGWKRFNTDICTDEIWIYV